MPAATPAPGLARPDPARLPRLTIVGPETVVPCLPDAVGRPVQQWRGRGGQTVAYGYSAGGAHWMHLPGLATFRFADPDEVTAIAPPTASRERVRDVYRRAVLPFALQAFGLEVLHGSAVVTGRGIVAFCAGSGTGKSTLAYGLHRRGYRLWADDAVAFQSGPGGLRAVPLPFRLRLRLPSLSHFRPDGPCDEIGAGPDHAEDHPVPLAGVLLLQRTDPSEDAAVEVRRLSAGDALAGVLAHAQSFSVEDPARKRRMVHQYLDLVARVQVSRIRFPESLERLVEVLDHVERAIV